MQCVRLLGLGSGGKPRAGAVAYLRLPKRIAVMDVLPRLQTALGDRDALTVMADSNAGQTPPGLAGSPRPPERTSHELG